MNSKPDYSAAWRDLRKRRLLVWALFLGFIPGVVALCFLVDAFLPGTIGNKQGESVCMGIGALWMLAFFIAAMRASFFRCPRCHGTFLMTWYFANPLASRCLHCGLRSGTILE